MRIYNGVTIAKTGRAPWDYRVCLGGRYRWGTLVELRRDIDQYQAGAGLPAPVRGFA